MIAPEPGDSHLGLLPFGRKCFCARVPGQKIPLIRVHWAAALSSQGAACLADSAAFIGGPAWIRLPVGWPWRSHDTGSRHAPGRQATSS